MTPQLEKAWSKPWRYCQQLESTTNSLRIRRNGSVKMQAFQFAEDISDKNVHFRAQRNPVRVVGNPDRPAAKFSMRNQPVLILDVNTLNLKIELDCLAKNAGDPDLLAFGHRHFHEKWRVTGEGHDTDSVPVVQNLAPNQQHRGDDIADGFHLDPFPFRDVVWIGQHHATAPKAVWLESRFRSDFFPGVSFDLLESDWLQAFLANNRLVPGVELSERSGQTIRSALDFHNDLVSGVPEPGP